MDDGWDDDAEVALESADLRDADPHREERRPLIDRRQVLGLNV